MAHRKWRTAHASSVALGAALALCALSCGAAESRSSESSEAKQPSQVTDTQPRSARAEREVAKAPTSRAARLEAARAHLAEGAGTPSRVQAAQRHALAVLENNPTDVEALLVAGQTSLLKGDAMGAARFYRAATSANPQSATAFLGLGDALTRLGDETGATAAFGTYETLEGITRPEPRSRQR